MRRTTNNVIIKITDPVTILRYCFYETFRHVTATIDLLMTLTVLQLTRMTILVTSFRDYALNRPLLCGDWIDIHRTKTRGNE